jgi:AraC-like DNA-binding protein
MTFYHQQILKLNQQLYSKEYLCNQVIQSKLYIDNHYSKNITLADITTSAHFSKFHFLRLFKKFYGTTPYQYLTEVRIKEAKQNLQSGMTVSEACFSVGFDSVTSFIGLFKKITGTTPLTYRNKKHLI